MACMDRGMQAEEDNRWTIEVAWEAANKGTNELLISLSQTSLWKPINLKILIVKKAVKKGRFESNLYMFKTWYPSNSSNKWYWISVFYIIITLR